TESEEEWMYGEMLKTPTEVAIAMLGAVAGTDLRPLLSGLKLPVLLVNGTRSAVPYDVGGWLQDHLQDSRRLVLEGAGHSPNWDGGWAGHRWSGCWSNRKRLSVRIVSW